MNYKVGDKVKIVNKLALHGTITTITAIFENERGRLKYNLKGVREPSLGFYEHEFERVTKLHEVLE